MAGLLLRFTSHLEAIRRRRKMLVKLNRRRRGRVSSPLWIFYGRIYAAYFRADLQSDFFCHPRLRKFFLIELRDHYLSGIISSTIFESNKAWSRKIIILFLGNGMIFQRKAFATAFSCLGLLSGCANMTDFHIRENLSNGHATQTLVDAKTRAIIAVPTSTSAFNGSVMATLKFCAEPSPDALSAIAASANGSLSVKDKAQIAAAFQIAETASNIGLRTQSIQLMRDSMFRLCEQTASGTLTSVQFETMFRHFQNSMVAILAIEQLTGTVRPAAVALSTGVTYGSTKDIATLTESAAKAETAAADATTDAKAKDEAPTAAKAKADAYLKDASASDEASLPPDKADGYRPLKQAVTDATAAKAAAEVAMTNANETLAVYKMGMNAIGGGDLATNGTAVASGGSGSSVTDNSAQVIAAAVLQIVDREVGSGFFRENCATLYDQELSGTLSSFLASDTSVLSLRNQCGEYAKATVAALTAQTSLIDAARENITLQTTKKESIPADKLAQLISSVGGGFRAAQPAALKLTVDSPLGQALAKVVENNPVRKEGAMPKAKPATKSKAAPKK